MRIVYYCQHVLGVGHFHRSLEICKALARNHETHMILGGPKVELHDSTIGYFQLPGLEMDKNFQNLRPCDPTLSLEQVKKDRSDQLFSFISSLSPDIFIIELYPFGRKAFRFELDPVLQGIKVGSLPSCLVFCSLRDILVEREDQEKFEKRVLATFNNYFHGLLIHADDELMSLETTFSRASELIPPVRYTGYVTPRSRLMGRQQKRKELGLHPNDRLIVVSIGGGNVGHELLEACLDAFGHINQKNYFLQIFTGPYSENSLLEHLKENTCSRVTITRFTNNFSNWLAAADLSVSMAGYNTCMNVLAEGVPALLYPFNQNSEQRMRAEKLLSHHALHLLAPQELHPTSLALLMVTYANSPRFTTTINLSGAANTVQILENW